MGDRGELVVNVEMPKEATIQQTNLKTQEIEQYLLTKPFVINVFSTIGKSENQFSAQGSKDAAEISVKLVDKTKRPFSTEQFSQQIKRELQEKIEGAKIKISNVDIMGSTSEAPIQLLLNGSDMEQLLSFADTVYARMRTVPGSADQKISIENNKPEVSVKVDKGKMHSFGLTMAQVGSVLKLAFNGDNESKLLQGQYEYDINVKLDAFNRESVDELKQLTFKNALNQNIRLDQFATVEKSIGPAMLERKDRISSVTVSSQVVGRPQGTVGAEIKALMDANATPDGITVSYEGNMKQQAEAFGSLGYALIASIIFVYLIMVALYNSYVYPFVVLFSIPVAMVGALLALAMTMQSLNIFSILGIIMLVGLVAKNAILLVDFANQLKERGYKVFDALLESGRTRLRPILMTTIAMVIGMLPLALATGAGAEWKNGMAWALIGGLTSSMLLTLVVVPVVYVIIDKLKDRFSGNEREEKTFRASLNLS
jgi:HAE1 family hydrophobic/amphiphilic exporter-1